MYGTLKNFHAAEGTVWRRAESIAWKVLGADEEPIATRGLRIYQELHLQPLTLGTWPAVEIPYSNDDLYIRTFSR